MTHTSAIEAMKVEFAAEKDEVAEQTKVEYIYFSFVALLIYHTQASERFLHYDEVNALRAQAEADMENLRASHQQELDNFKTAHDRELKALKEIQDDNHSIGGGELAINSRVDVAAAEVDIPHDEEAIPLPPTQAGATQSNDAPPLSPPDADASTPSINNNESVEANAEENDATLAELPLEDKDGPTVSDTEPTANSELTTEGGTKVPATDKTKDEEKDATDHNGIENKPTGDTDQLEKKSLVVSRHKSKRSKIFRGMVEPIRRVFSHKGEAKAAPMEEKV